ncbi:restriction endonuclease subunit S [Streptomyces hawaiiensis]|uniref:restriction endonuclease subunit S n=1 Tax=Streptomyces hawaiiensis TaxID=67305 RepID=UPI0031D9ADCB
MISYRIKDVARINRRSLTEDTDHDFRFRYIDISAVDSLGHITVPEEETTFSAAPSRARRLAPAGAVVVSTVRTYLRAIGRVPDSEESLVFSTGFAVLEAGPRIDGRYLAYHCASHGFVDEVVARSTGVSYPAINPSEIGNLSINLPPLDEQRRIADYLDAETKRLDKMATLRDRQRDVLTARRWSHFQEILDAARGPVIPLRRVVRSVIDGPFGSAFSSADYVDGGAAVVRLGNIGFAEYRPADQAYIPMSLYRQFQYHQVSRGDVLIAGLGDARNHAGRACVAPHLGPAIVKGKCFRARLETETADAEFIALLLSSPVGASAIEGRGSTRSMINLEILKAALLPIPELRKQRSVVAEHRQSWEWTKVAVAACERQLDLLAERRQALITAAVTGQFDVTTASGRNLPEGVAV